MDLLQFRLVTATISALSCYVLGGLVFLKDRNSKLHRYFAFFNLALGTWNISDVAIVTVPDQFALALDRFSYAVALLMVPSFAYLSMAIGQREMNPRFTRWFLWVPGFLLFPASFTPWLIKSVQTTPHLVENPGPLYPAFALYLLYWVGFGVFHVFKGYRVAKGIRKNQLKYVFMGFFFGLLAAADYIVSILYPQLPAVYYVLVTVYNSIIFLAIIRYKLMDINLVFRYATIYVLFALSLTIPFSLLAVLFPHTATILLSVFAALAFGPIIEKRVIGIFRRFVDKLPPFRGRYQVMSGIPGFQRVIATSASVNHWATNVVDSINRLIEVSNVVVYIYDERHQMYMAKAAVGIDFGKMLYGAPRETDPLILHLRETKKIIQKDYVAIEIPADQREAVLTSLNLISAHICAPFFNGNDLIGFVSVGKKVRKGFSRFTADHIRLQNMRNILDLPTHVTPAFRHVFKLLSKQLGLTGEDDALSLTAEQIAEGLNGVADQRLFIEDLRDPESLGLRSEALALLGRARRAATDPDARLSKEESTILNAAVLCRLFQDELILVEGEDLYHDEDLKALWGLVQGAEGALMVILVTLAGQMKTAEWAHDLRHPFTKGSFRLIDAILAGKMGEIPKDVARALLAVRDDASYVERQIKSLIDPNQADALNKKNASAGALFKAVEERYRYVVELSNIHFQTDLPAADSAIFCDPDQVLYRVFNNLMDNALRCTPAGGRLTIGYVPNGRFVTCYVMNVGGEPIPQDVLPHLFERSSQVKRLDNSGLAGLGLFNVAKAVKDHGGEITVSSDKIAGTKFQFTLPLASN